LSSHLYTFLFAQLLWENLFNDFSNGRTLACIYCLTNAINFSKVIIEIHFQRNLQWFLSLCGRTEIEPQQFGMNNCFKLEKNSIAGILEGIRYMGHFASFPRHPYRQGRCSHYEVSGSSKHGYNSTNETQFLWNFPLSMW
jgi:hypothetical protein